MKRQLTYERLNDGTDRTFSDLNDKDQIALVKSRLKLYANSVYRKTKVWLFWIIISYDYFMWHLWESFFLLYIIRHLCNLTILIWLLIYFNLYDFHQLRRNRYLFIILFLISFFFAYIFFPICSTSFILFYFILFYFILFYFILFYFILLIWRI